MVSSRKHTPLLNKTLHHYIGTSGLKRSQIQLIKVINPGVRGLSEIYNAALKAARYEVVCCLHDDLRFARNSHWGLQVIKAFTTSHFAALSAAGSVSLAQNGVFWQRREHLVGRVKHLIPVDPEAPTGHTRVYESYYSERFKNPLPVAVLDGLFLAMYRPRLYNPQPFDTDFHFHFYDLAFSLRQTLAQPRSCGVLTQLGITHKSPGRPNKHYLKQQRHFVLKYQRHLPFFLRPSIQPTRAVTGAQTRVTQPRITQTLQIPQAPVQVIYVSDTDTAPPLFEALKAHGVTLNIQRLAPHRFSLKDLAYQLQQMPNPRAECVYLHHQQVSLSLAHWLALYARWKRNQQQGIHAILSPRLHYADTHLLYDAGIKNRVHLGMHQPYTYRLCSYPVDQSQWRCAFMGLTQDLTQHRIEGDIWGLWDSPS